MTPVGVSDSRMAYRLIVCNGVHVCVCAVVGWLLCLSCEEGELVRLLVLRRRDCRIRVGQIH